MGLKTGVLFPPGPCVFLFVITSDWLFVEIGACCVTSAAFIYPIILRYLTNAVERASIYKELINTLRIGSVSCRYIYDHIGSKHVAGMKYIMYTVCDGN